ncbi:hypothetical protein OA56_07120 [Tepidiphilus sp. HLB4]
MSDDPFTSQTPIYRRQRLPQQSFIQRIPCLIYWNPAASRQAGIRNFPINFQQSFNCIILQQIIVVERLDKLTPCQLDATL